ncbi:MAG: DUF1249 domain-containing protein [Gammaproteobacteria bacterium]|nr:DUF1249 domain-containing protein [Gammaproteobacteria bacterium]
MKNPAEGNADFRQWLQQKLPAESLLPSSWRARPGSFVALMSLYESNHRRLGELAGELRSLDGLHRSSVQGDVDLELRVSERSPYTTMLQLTYVFGDDAVPATAPDMEIRVYHDARLAEAHSWANTHEHPLLRDWRQHAGLDLDQRWARNIMLNKWLEYCLEQGHGFRRLRDAP